MLIKSAYFYSIVMGGPAHSEISLVWNPAFHKSALDIRSNTFSWPHTASNCFSRGWKVVASFLLRTRCYRISGLSVSSKIARTPTGPTQTNILIQEQRDGAIKSCTMKELCLRDGEVGGCGSFFLLKGWKGIMEEKGMKKKAGKEGAKRGRDGGCDLFGCWTMTLPVEKVSLAAPWLCPRLMAATGRSPTPTAAWIHSGTNLRVEQMWK